MEKSKMYIDATHPEETRVVVARNGRVEEFDFESASRKLLRGNIYLAKVTRVEPSLQAAFVEYGGNRHGFLAFNEIHPDYYQIPVADRELLKQQEAEAEAAAEAEADERARYRDGGRRRNGRGGQRDRERFARDDRGPAEPAPRSDEVYPGDVAEAPYSEPSDHQRTEFRTEPPAHDEPAPHQSYDPAPQAPSVERQEAAVAPSDLHGDGSAAGNPPAAPLRSDHTDADVRHAHPSAHEHQDQRLPDEAHGHDERLAADARFEVAEAPSAIEELGGGEPSSFTPHRHGNGHGDSDGADQVEQVEQVVGEEDALEELPERPRRRARQYKIQEVIKRRQIMLIQVVKEERGNKGAALTTYISLAGRYTVLMPNSGRGGGISRKITQAQDRKRLKAIAEELEVPEGMGLIIRTAGAARTMQEIRRDYEYLLRLWERVRELTLTSTAPCLVYEEGNLLKRSIRDLYTKDMEEILVAGEDAYCEARDFMGMLMPGHSDHVVRYDGAEPLYGRFGVERQLNALFHPRVTLRSGGYIVINQTEALVAIDVNSGKSTREFSIEETALNTNMEAAEEVARQVKLRDLAGLIVIDFIDMEEKRNNRSVERRLKDALRHDRARIQVGRISHFGLLEMSRQRLRSGVVEGSTSQCPHCEGTGIVRSTESVALAVLRAIEDQLMRQPTSLKVTTATEAALYILNNKRPFIIETERRFGIVITVEADHRMLGANFTVERSSAPRVEPVRVPSRAAVNMEWGFNGSDADEELPVEAAVERDDEEAGQVVEVREPGEEGEGFTDEPGRNRRRRRRRGRRDGDDRRPQGDSHDRDRGPRPSASSAEGGASYESPVAAGPAVNGDAHPQREYAATSDEAIGEPLEFAASGPAPSDAGPYGAPGESDRPRRGRRSGRRGGRARGRDGEPMREGVVAEVEPGDWGLPDVARPGAEQPGSFADVGVAATPLGAGGSHAPQSMTETVYAAPEVAYAPAERPQVVEYVPAPTFAPASHPAVETAPAPRIVEIVAEAPVHVAPAAAAPEPAVAPTHEEPRVEPVASMPEPVPAAPVPPPAAEHAVATPPAPPAPMPQSVAATPVVEEPARPARKGWWQRKFGGDT